MGRRSTTRSLLQSIQLSALSLKLNKERFDLNDLILSVVGDY